MQHATELACFLLLRDGGKADERRVTQMDNSIEEGDTKAFALRAAVPLVIRYQTCDADGKELRLHPDIYRRDAALAKAWENASLPLISAAISEETSRLVAHQITQKSPPACRGAFLSETT